MVVAFLRRITGTDERSLVQEHRLHRNLNDMTQKNKDLDRLAAQLDQVIEKVGSQSLQTSIMPSGISGEHRLDLPGIPSPPKEVLIHVRESEPGKNGSEGD